LNLYYPAWTMYDFRPDPKKVPNKLPDRDVFHNNDQAFWTGTKDIIDFPEKGKVIVEADQCIRHYQQQRTTITSAPFVTWFNDGEGDFYNIQGETMSLGPWNNLSDQSVLPSDRFTFNHGVAHKENATRIYHDLPQNVFTGGSSLFIVGNTPGILFDLFRTEIKLKSTHYISLVVSDDSAGLNIKPQILMIGGDVDYVILKLSNSVKLNNGWARLFFAIPDHIVGHVMGRIQLQLAQKDGFYLGEFAFLDSGDQPPQRPWVKPFPGNADELNWSGMETFDPTSHYRVYGMKNGVPKLIGVVYNCVYRTAYGDPPYRMETDHIFNMELKDFDSYKVQEVNKYGNFTPV
jgi:Glycosyl hydrolase family 85